MRRFLLKQLLTSRLSALFAVLLLIIGPLSSINGQVESSWQIVKKTSERSFRLHYIDAGPPKPVFELRCPSLKSAFFADDNNGWVVGERGALVRTSDGGQTWKESLIDPIIDFNGVFFRSGQKGWAVGSKGVRGEGWNGVILFTEDGGANWRTQYIEERFELSWLQDIWFVNERNGWVVGEVELEDGGSGRIILATQDGGNNWRTQYLRDEVTVSLQTLEFTDSKNGWVIGRGLILHTEDGGLHWNEQFYDTSISLFGADFVSSLEGWAVGEKDWVLYTKDGGTTWVNSRLSSNKDKAWLLGVEFVNRGEGWIIGSGGASFHTKNGGRTWKWKGTPLKEDLNDLAITSKSVFAVTSGGVILRMDR